MNYVNDGAGSADEQWIYPLRNYDTCSDNGGQACSWTEATCLEDDYGDGWSDNFYRYTIDFHN